MQGLTEEIRSGRLDGVGKSRAGESVFILTCVDIILRFALLLGFLLFPDADPAVQVLYMVR